MSQWLVRDSTLTGTVKVPVFLCVFGTFSLSSVVCRSRSDNFELPAASFFFAVWEEVVTNSCIISSCLNCFVAPRPVLLVLP